MGADDYHVSVEAMEGQEIDLWGYIRWAQEKPGQRTCKIETTDDGRVSVWLYEVVVGVFAVYEGEVRIAPGEIDMDKIKEIDDRATFERLKAKFEGGNG